MALRRPSNEPNEELFRKRSDSSFAEDDPHAVPTKVRSVPVGVEQLMAEAEKQGQLPAPARPNPSAKNAAGELPSLVDEADASLLEPTLVAGPPPDSLSSSAPDGVR